MEEWHSPKFTISACHSAIQILPSLVYFWKLEFDKRRNLIETIWLNQVDNGYSQSMWKRRIGSPGSPLEV